MTDLSKDGLRISSQDLSAITPTAGDNGRIYNHNGTGTITLFDDTTTSDSGYYVWVHSSGKWKPLQFGNTASSGNADTLDGYDSVHFAVLAEDETITGAWDFTGDLKHGGEDVTHVKTAPNLHLPGTELEASGGNNAATQTLFVPEGLTFSLWGWGVLDEAGTSPADVDLYVKSGDLTGTPTTEYSNTTASGWTEGSTGSALTTVVGGTGGTALHIQMVNNGASAVSNVSLRASYTIE